MKQLISSHNRKVMMKFEGREAPSSYGCNCHGGPTTCPLQAECLTPSLVYEGTVKVGDDSKTYVGQTCRTFKTRWNIHNSDVNCGRRRTGMTDYLLDLKEKGVTPDSISWSKLATAYPRGRGSRMCSLCLTEKVLIATADRDFSLNERSEVTRRCRHRDEHLLTNFLSHHSSRNTNEEEDPGGPKEVQGGPEENLGGQEEDQGGQGEDQIDLEEDQQEQEEEEGQEEEELPEGARRLRKKRVTSYKHFY